MLNYKLLSLFSVFSFLYVLANTTNAVANYQQTKSVSGNITYARVCNNDHNYEVETTSVLKSNTKGNPVVAFKVNIKNRQQHKVPIAGFWVPRSPMSGYNWRTVSSDFNWGGQIQKTYKNSYWSFWGLEMDTKDEIVIGNEVRMASGQNVFDIGGLISLGSIGHGSCRTYDNGRVY